MNENSTHTDLLIQYLDGELQGEQLEAIKKDIEENADIRQELENLRSAKEAVKRFGLQNRIRTVHTEMMQELKTEPGTKAVIRKMIYQFSLRTAAVLIVLFGISALYQYYTGTPEKLFTEKFQAFDLRETRGTNSSLEDLYKAGNMPAVIQEFSALKSPKPEDYFLAGNAFLESHQPAKAIESFTKLQQENKDSNTHYFDEDAEYFLALSFLANREPQKAIPLLEKIHADNNNPYNQKVGSWFLLRVKKTASN